jgi:hypothetical protein
MAAGAHYLEDWGHPQSGREIRGVPDSILDRSGLRSNQQRGKEKVGRDCD